MTSESTQETPSTIYDVPMAVVQALYHEITGKTESLYFHSSKGFLCRMDDLKDFYQKLQQTLEHYEIIGLTTTVNIRYKDDRSATYSSWEKFSQIDTTKREPVREIGFKVELVVNFPSVEKALAAPRYQRYIIDLNLFSKAIMIESIPNLKFFRIFDSPTVHVKIDYVDYVFAKKILRMIEEWIDNLPEIRSKWHYPKLQDLSLHYWWILGKAGTLSALVPCYLMLVAGDLADLEDLALWSLLAVGFVTFIQLIMKIAAEMIEKYVDSTKDLSYLCINRGDSENYEKIHRQNKSSILKAIAVTTSSVFIVALNCLSAWIYDWFIK